MLSSSARHYVAQRVTIDDCVQIDDDACATTSQLSDDSLCDGISNINNMEIPKIIHFIWLAGSPMLRFPFLDDTKLRDANDDVIIDDGECNNENKRTVEDSR